MKSRSYSLFKWVNNLGLLSVLLVMIYPFLYVVAVSLSTPDAVMQNKVTVLPVGFNLHAYQAVLANPAIWLCYRNTILYTSVGTLINLSLTTLTAYALAKKELFGRRFFTMFFVFTMFFQGGIIPSYILVKSLGLVDSMWAVILPTAISTWNLIIMRTFFSQLPVELEEAAVIDGCNPLQVLSKIVLPLSKPILATMFLFYAVWHWNSYFAPLIYLHDKNKYPLQVLLQQILIIGETSFSSITANTENPDLLISDTIKYATIMVAILPIITIYPFIQKYFVKGVMMGSIKG